MQDVFYQPLRAAFCRIFPGKARAEQNVEGQIPGKLVVHARSAGCDVDDETVLPDLGQAFFTEIAGGNGIENIVETGNFFRKLRKGEGLMPPRHCHGKLRGIAHRYGDAGVEAPKSLGDQAAAPTEAKDEAVALVKEGFPV